MNEKMSSLMEENRVHDESSENVKQVVEVRTILFVVAGVLVVACMFLNWLSIEMDLKIAQFNGILGKMNAITMYDTLGELEDSLGMFANYLPKEFSVLKSWSLFLMVCALAAIALYILGIVMQIIKKRAAVFISGAGAVCAIVTSIGFYLLVNAIYKGIGDDIFQITWKVPCSLVLIGGLVSGICALHQAIVSGANVSGCDHFDAAVQFIKQLLFSVTCAIVLMVFTVTVVEFNNIVDYVFGETFNCVICKNEVRQIPHKMTVLGYEVWLCDSCSETVDQVEDIYKSIVE